MAAIYSGIHLKLKSPRTSWVDKLKLARFAWISPQCFLPNKEQLLLDWTSHALSGYYSKKLELPQTVVDGLWAYLDDILHSRKLQKALGQGKALSLRISVAQVINARLSECASGVCPVSTSTVLSCCQGVLSCPALSATYAAKYELLVELVSRLCSLACSTLEPSVSGERPLAPQAFEVLHLALVSYVTAQRQQTNPNRVFAQVTAHLLQPFLLLRHLLSVRPWAADDDARLRQHLSRELRSRVDAALQSALFAPDHLPSYREELLTERQAPGAKKGPAGKGLLSPVSTILKKVCDPSLPFAMRSNSLPLIFKFSLDAFSKGEDHKMVSFHMLARFTAALDLTDALTLTDAFDPENWNLTLFALENLLSSGLAADIYNVAADRIQHGEVQFNFYRKVAQLLFNNGQPSVPAWYRCLKCLLSLNHLIIEPDLDELICSAWIDADCTEQRVVKAREALVAEVFHTYEKLRQFPRLLQEVLEVICRPAVDELRPPVLTVTLEKTLRRSILDSPLSQNLEMCHLILAKMQSCLLSDLQFQEDLALKLFSVSVLLHSVLFSMKTLDNSTPTPATRRAHDLMEDMAIVIKSLLCQLHSMAPASLCFDKVLEATLLLSYTWVTVDTLLCIHCSKYTSAVDAGGGSLAEESCCLFPCLAVQEWERLAIDPWSCGPSCQLLLELLALQRMKLILLRTDVSDGKTRDVLCKVARFIVKSDRGACFRSCGKDWDGQVSSVDVDSYPVAHWLYVTSNLALLAPYLTENDLRYIANVLVSSVVREDIVDGGTQDSHLSVAVISRQLLGSMVLEQLSSVYSLVVRCFLKNIVGTLSLSPESTQCKALLMFGETDFDEKEAAVVEGAKGSVEVPLSLNRLQSVAQEVLNSVEAGLSITLSQTQTEDLLQLLQASVALNPDAVSPEGHSEYCLLLLLIASTIQCDKDTEPHKFLHLLKEVYGLMASWETGKNRGSVLKVVYGSVLLEAVVTSLFSHGRMTASRMADHSTRQPFFQVAKNLFQWLIQTVIYRMRSVHLNLEKFTSFLVESKVTSSTLSSLDEKLRSEDLVPLQLLLVTFGTLCQTLSCNLGRNKKMDEALLPLLEKAIPAMASAVQTSLKHETCVLLGQSFTVEVVTGMLQAELALATCSAFGQDSAEEGPPVLLSHMSLYKSFSQQILRELSSSPRPINFLSSSLLFLTIYHSAVRSVKEPELDELFVSLIQNLRKLLSASWLSVSDVRELEPAAGSLLGQLVAGSSVEQFQNLLVMLGEDLSASWVSAGQHTEVLWTMTIAKLLASCSLPETHSRAFWIMAPQIISAVVSVVKESSKEKSLTDIVTVPALDTLAIVLRQGEGLLLNPHHVTQALGALVFIPLELSSPDVYLSAFRAVHETLFAVIRCHTQVMLKAAPAFLNCFYRLVASVMHEGRQKGDNEKGFEQGFEVLLKCARLVERMYTHIATAAEGFTLLSCFMVAQYVCELQKVTLHPDIKRHLTEGIYAILDLCLEKDIKFLQSTLPAGVREVFGELHASYLHYHKSQRQGEEKYTA